MIHDEYESDHLDEAVRFTLRVSGADEPLTVAEASPEGVARLSDRALRENLTAAFEAAVEAEGRQHYQISVTTRKEYLHTQQATQNWVPTDDDPEHLRRELRLQVEQLISRWRYDPLEAERYVPWEGKKRTHE